MKTGKYVNKQSTVFKTKRVTRILKTDSMSAGQNLFNSLQMLKMREPVLPVLLHT